MRGTWGPLGGTQRETGHGSRPRPVFPVLTHLDNSPEKAASRAEHPPHSPNGASLKDVTSGTPQGMTAFTG